MVEVIRGWYRERWPSHSLAAVHIGRSTRLSRPLIASAVVQTRSQVVCSYVSQASRLTMPRLKSPVHSSLGDFAQLGRASYWRTFETADTSATLVQGREQKNILTSIVLPEPAARLRRLLDISSLVLHSSALLFCMYAL